MPREKQGKLLCVDNLRHAEYYQMQDTFDDLYARSKAGEKFTNLMDVILSPNNILLAYRNIKGNSGSQTPGTDKQTIRNISDLTTDEVMFNSTLHAGEVKSYIQLCLAISHQALVQQRAMRTKTQSDNEKYTFRTWLLRLGMIGDEFKTARQHLLKNLDGNIAWKDPAQAIEQRERLLRQRLEAQTGHIQESAPSAVGVEEHREETDMVMELS